MPRRHAPLLIVGDLVCATLGVLLACVLRPHHFDLGSVSLALAVAAPIGWVVLVALNRGYEVRFLGAGSSEFARLFYAFLQCVALMTFGSYAVDPHATRDLTVLALPATLLCSLAYRAVGRTWLHRRRARGQSVIGVVAVGSPEAVAQFADTMRENSAAGMRVVGACVPGAERRATRALRERDIPVIGDLDSVLQAVADSGAQRVAVLAGDTAALSVRRIAWQLEGADAELVVVPGIEDVSGRRLHIQPVAGVPLLHVDEPQFGGVGRAIKSIFDRTAALLGLLILSPVLLLLALLVKLTSEGPALFVQTRVGRDGRTFRMIKFRSMYSGAERQVSELKNRNEAADGLLFKIRNDPRVTPVGRFLRKSSLDELPQLFNVLTGSMSLVGPRPALPSEVAQYGQTVYRRLLVKPGLTGLWQVSGRSDLSWEESVRLDLHYVENWSLALDAAVLARTARVVFSAAGAY
jgi:exopolysaccharide biosynthesis polyprenyl glycosylphosphotransferase